MLIGSYNWLLKCVYMGLHKRCIGVAYLQWILMATHSLRLSRNVLSIMCLGGGKEFKSSRTRSPEDDRIASLLLTEIPSKVFRFSVVSLSSLTSCGNDEEDELFETLVSGAGPFLRRLEEHCLCRFELSMHMLATLKQGWAVLTCL